MNSPEYPSKFSLCGDISAIAKCEGVKILITIKGTTFILSDLEAQWLRDWLNRVLPPKEDVV